MFKINASQKNSKRSQYTETSMQIRYQVHTRDLSIAITCYSTTLKELMDCYHSYTKQGFVYHHCSHGGKNTQQRA